MGGQRTGLMSFLVSQMFPGTLMLIPLYIIIVQWLHLGSNYLGLILLYSTTAIPFCVWMLKGYFDTIPKDLEESAIMDGASQFTIFWRIILPLTRPILAVIFIITVVNTFSEYLLARTMLRSTDQLTYILGLHNYTLAQYASKWGELAAGAVVYRAADALSEHHRAVRWQRSCP